MGSPRVRGLELNSGEFTIYSLKLVSKGDDGIVLLEAPDTRTAQMSLARFIGVLSLHFDEWAFEVLQLD